MLASDGNHHAKIQITMDSEGGEFVALSLIK